MVDLKNIQIKPAIEYIRYSETKLLLYLGILILLVTFFIGYSLYSIRSINHKLNKIESYVDNNNDNEMDLLANTITDKFDKFLSSINIVSREVRSTVEVE